MDTFGEAGIRTSILVGTDTEMIEYAAKAGADRVELYTEPYASKVWKESRSCHCLLSLRLQGNPQRWEWDWKLVMISA